MANILRNPTLSGFSKAIFLTDNDGNVGAIENPDHWEYVYTSLHPEDPNRIPASLHQDHGFSMSAGWRVWEAGYVQHQVTLQAGQRYLAKAQFMPDVNFSPGAEPDLHAVEWRFWIEGDGEHVAQEWHSTSKGAYKQDEETLFVIEAAHDITVDVYFKARSRFAGNACAFNIYSINLETIAADYGGSNVAVIGQQASSTGKTEEVDVILPDHTFSSQAVTGTALSGKSLADVLTAEDIDIIVKGLNQMTTLTTHPTVLAAFQRLADVFQRLK